MNQKVMIILSSLIVLISLFGLTLQGGGKSQKDEEAVVPKRSYTIFSAAKDIVAGEVITPEDFKADTLQAEEGKDWGDIVVDKSRDFILDSIAIKSISKDEKISYADFAQPGSIEYNKLRASPSKGFFSFGFVIDQREYAILQKLKPNERVDIYFRYETKNAIKRSGSVVPKKQGYSSENNANSTNLLLMFSDKRVLFLEKNLDLSSSHTTQEEAKDLDVRSHSKSKLYIELSQEEIKRIYATENLGYFFIFPTITSAQQALSTDNILTKDFVKELRGGADASSSSSN